MCFKILIQLVDTSSAQLRDTWWLIPDVPSLCAFRLKKNYFMVFWEGGFLRRRALGLVWLEFGLGEKDKKYFCANKFSKLLHVAGWHMSNTSQNKSIIRTHKALSTLNNREVRVA
jgi:hypothetical protein